MDLNSSRSERQRLVVKRWQLSNWNGTANCTRRFGKTNIAKIAIQEYRVYRPDSTVIVVSPSAVVNMNAKQNLALDDKIKFVTSNELIEAWKRDKCLPHGDFYIFDEIHNFLNGASFNILCKCPASCKLGLTGSTLTPHQKSLLANVNMPVCDSVNEREAVTNGWISNYMEYNLAVKFTEADAKKYAHYSETLKDMGDKYSGLYKQFNRYIDHDVFSSTFDFILACHLGKMVEIPKKNYKGFIKNTVFRNFAAENRDWRPNMDLTNPYYAERDKHWNPANIGENAKIYYNVMRSRNNLLVDNDTKADIAEQIIRKFDVPTIVFNEVTAMCDKLYERFDNKAIRYYSNIEKTCMKDPVTGEWMRYKNGKIKEFGQTALLKLVVQGMREGYYKYLFCAKALNEGLTIENIELVITTGGTVNPVSHEQRSSRGKTLDYSNPNKICIIVNLYCDDFTLGDKEIRSRDKAKLIQRQSTGEYEPIWIDNIEDIVC